MSAQGTAAQTVSADRLLPPLGRRALGRLQLGEERVY